LSKKIKAESLNPDMLIGKYIPNLIAEPFAITKDYVQRIFDQTSSPKLDKVLRHWERDNWEVTQSRQKLAYTILVELLAYQFASPVRWIETQDRLFDRFKCERFIEIGPGPTLTGMATRTLKAKYESEDSSVSRTRIILCHAKNTKEVYYQFEDAPPEVSQSDDSTTAAAEAAPQVVVAAVAAPPRSSAAVALEDEPLKATNVLRTIVAQKLKKRSDEIPLSKTIKELVGGKSTLQNELLGDLQLEFSATPEKGEELPLDELGSVLDTGYSGSLGKYTSGLVSRLVSGKMPGGFGVSAIKGHLSKSWGIGTQRADAVLLLALTNEPAKRLASENEAKSWLDGLASTYASQAGISLSSGASAGGQATGGAATINSEEFIQFQNRQNRFADQQVQLHMRYLGLDSRAGERAHELAKNETVSLQSKLDDIAKEHGDTYIEGIRPVFEPLKARHFDSSWNWARHTTVDREITARCIAIMNRADPALLRYMQYHIEHVDPEQGETYRLAKEFGQQLIDNCKEAAGANPVYKDGAYWSEFRLNTLKPFSSYLPHRAAD
jgi:fatty acid synthase subunit alpha